MKVEGKPSNLEATEWMKFCKCWLPARAFRQQWQTLTHGGLSGKRQSLTVRFPSEHFATHPLMPCAVFQRRAVYSREPWKRWPLALKPQVICSGQVPRSTCGREAGLDRESTRRHELRTRDRHCQWRAIRSERDSWSDHTCGQTPGLPDSSARCAVCCTTATRKCRAKANSNSATWL